MLSRLFASRAAASFAKFNRDPVTLPLPKTKHIANPDGTYSLLSGKNALNVDKATYQQCVQADREFFGANAIPATAEETLAQRKLEYYIQHKNFSAFHGALFVGFFAWMHRPGAYEQQVPSKFEWIATQRAGLYSLADAFDADVPQSKYDPETFGKAPEHHPPYLPLYTYEVPDVNV